MLEKQKVLLQVDLSLITNRISENFNFGNCTQDTLYVHISKLYRWNRFYLNRKTINAWVVVSLGGESQNSSYLKKKILVKGSLQNRLSARLTIELMQPITKYCSELLDKHKQWCVHRQDIFFSFLSKLLSCNLLLCFVLHSAPLNHLFCKLGQT